jgi:hypothetical protein
MQAVSGATIARSRGGAADRANLGPGRRPRPPSRSIVGVLFDGLVAAVPYAVVALALRIVIARVFLFGGQSSIVGMRLPLTWREFVSSILLPMQVKSTYSQIEYLQIINLRRFT